jgi:hypothetical protein
MIDTMIVEATVPEPILIDMITANIITGAILLDAIILKVVVDPTIESMNPAIVDNMLEHIIEAIITDAIIDSLAIEEGGGCVDDRRAFAKSPHIDNLKIVKWVRSWPRALNCWQ